MVDLIERTSVVSVFLLTSNAVSFAPTTSATLIISNLSCFDSIFVAVNPFIFQSLLLFRKVVAALTAVSTPDSPDDKSKANIFNILFFSKNQ